MLNGGKVIPTDESSKKCYIHVNNGVIYNGSVISDGGSGFSFMGTGPGSGGSTKGDSFSFITDEIKASQQSSRKT
jgi:hypothetical protein